MTSPARIAIASVLAGTGCENAASRLDLERMTDQAMLEPYEATPLFADGAAMLPPPAHTVHRDRITGHPELTEGLLDGRETPSIPLAKTTAMLRHGRDRFDVFCTPCHGLDGFAQTEIAADMTLRPPPSLHEPRIRALAPGRIYRVIAWGWGLMPAYGQALNVLDRWAVVAYVDALQRSQDTQLAELPAAVRAEAEAALR